VRSGPSFDTSMVVAVTADDARAVRPFALFASMKRLSRRGVLVWASTVGRGRAGFRPMAWPPRLASFRVDRGWEGQPAANVQQRLRFGRVGDWDLDVRVYFGTQHPGRILLAKAQAELRRLRLPRH
jgi:hypothetical protein